MIKDMDEQPFEEIHRVRPGKIPSTGASVLGELGCITLLVHRCVHQPESSLNPIPLRLLQRLHYIGMINYQLHFQSLPSVEVGGGAGLKITVYGTHPLSTFPASLSPASCCKGGLTLRRASAVIPPSELPPCSVIPHGCSRKHCGVINRG